jgi:hypothetical protein
MKEINKNRWSRFCRDVARTYQFASTEVIRVDPDGIETMVCNRAPLLSMSLTRRRGKISAFEAKLGQIRNGSPVTFPLLLGAPTTILHQASENNGREVLEIQNEDGHKMIIRIAGNSTKESYDSFVRQIAYFLAEVRGFAPGHELKDWFMAERLIRKETLKSD